jgi:radical SAM protein with 4Fe4S-binding SPASM domain
LIFLYAKLFGFLDLFSIFSQKATLLANSTIPTSDLYDNFIRMKKFKKVYIEITNVCNLSCRFCPKSERKSKFMSAGSFSAILDQIKPFTDYIYFHVKGEPLLHPDLETFLALAEMKEFKVNITTNGTLLKTVSKKLVTSKSLRQINISLHSFSEQPDTQNKNEYLTNVVDFIKEAMEKTGIYISLRLWNLDYTNQKDKSNIEILKIIGKEFDMEIPLPDELVPGKNIKLTDRIFLHMESEFVWPNINESLEEKAGFCLGLRDQVAILACGTVVPCCLDSEGVIDLGNIFEQPFNQIISNDRAKALYNGFSSSVAVEKLCQKCQYKNRFQTSPVLQSKSKHILADNSECHVEN